MKPSISHPKDPKHLWLPSVLIIFSSLVAFLAVKDIKISSDSMVYSLISQEILAGNGIRLPIARLADNYYFVNGSIPFLEQPPLLPFLFAVLGGVTSQNYVPAQIINAVSHVAISLFTFLLMKEIYDNKGIALLTGILVCISFPLLWNANHMLSDALFIALVVAAFYFLVLYRHSDNYGSTRNLFVAGICASAAVLTRFPGMTLIPLFFWEAILVLKTKKIKTNYVSTVLAAALPLITTAALFVRNHIISGTILGYFPPLPERSHLDAFTGTIKMIFLQFGLGRRPAIIALIFAIIIVLYIVVSTQAKREILKHFHSGLDLVLIFIVSYTVLIYMSYTSTQTVFEPRYMSPLVPFLFIFCIIFIIVVREMIRFKGMPTLSLWTIVLSLGIVTMGNSYKTYLQRGDFFYNQRGPYSILNSSTFNWIKNNYGEDIIITTNQPFHLSFFGGYSTVRLPHKRFMSNIPIPDKMETFLPARMSKFGSQVLALFEKVDTEHDGNYLAGLFSTRENSQDFVLVQSFSDGVVYKLTK